MFGGGQVETVRDFGPKGDSYSLIAFVERDMPEEQFVFNDKLDYEVTDVVVQERKAPTFPGRGDCNRN
jgi:hypothetical protein